MRRLTIVFAVLALALMSFMVVQAQGRSGDVATHIIVFNDGANVNARQFANANGVTLTNEYQYVLNGFAAVVPDGRLAALSRNPNVAYVEENMVMSIAQTTSQVVPTGYDRAFASSNANIGGSATSGVDVDVAILDTGIDLEHPDLNVVGGIDCTLASGGGPFATRYCGTGNGGDDDQYHGTHVAGTVAAINNDIGVVGIAPGARLWAVKVLDSSGSGYTSGIVAGIDWVVAQGNIEVANMSLGGSGISTAYETAIDNAVAAGVTMVVAAGNSAADANNYSPAFVPSAITVSALADFDGVAGALGSPTCRADEDDTLANFSNYGTAVDIAAPGVCILSTYPLEQGSYASISGTSMAAPQVAGAAAILASMGRTPAQIDSILKSTGNFNYTDDSPDSVKEPLLDVSSSSAFAPAYATIGDGSGGGDPTPEPTPEPCNKPNPKACK